MSVQPVPLPDAGRLPAEPLVSILVTCHNYARFVDAALRSIERQTYERWECVVIDDGSTDDSVEVVRAAERRDPRIRLMSKPNRGAVSALLAALPQLSGDIVCFLDADDEMLPDRLASTVSAHQTNSGAGLVVHRLWVTDEGGRVVGVMPLAARLPSGDLRQRTLTGRAGIADLGVTSAMSVRADLLRWAFAHGLVPDAPGINDIDNLLRRTLPLMADVAAIDRPLGRRRLHGENHSRGLQQTMPVVLDRLLLVWEHVHDAQLRAIALLGLDPPSDDDLDELTMRFTRARLIGSDVASARGALFRSPSFSSLSSPRRLFWQVGARAPRWLFERMVWALFSPGGWKPLLNHLRSRRWRDQAAADSSIELLSTWAVIRTSLRGGW